MRHYDCGKPDCTNHYTLVEILSFIPIPPGATDTMRRLSFPFFYAT